MGWQYQFKQLHHCCSDKSSELKMKHLSCAHGVIILNELLNVQQHRQTLTALIKSSEVILIKSVLTTKTLRIDVVFCIAYVCSAHSSSCNKLMFMFWPWFNSCRN